MMSAKGAEKLEKAGRKSSNYAEYLRNNSNFATGEGNGVFFPRRRNSPDY